MDHGCKAPGWVPMAGSDSWARVGGAGCTDAALLMVEAEPIRRQGAAPDIERLAMTAAYPLLVLVQPEP